MDDRQSKIVEGAGLEDSRINQEFKDWLLKWMGPVLIVITVVALGYVAKIRWDQHKVSVLDAAFADLDAARDSGSPEGLLSVAQQHDDVAAVRDLATLAAADIRLASFRSGVRPGAQQDEKNNFKDEDLIDDEARNEQLDRASALYQEVLDRTKDDPAAAGRTMAAYAGLVSVKIGERDWDAAADLLNEQIQLANKRQMPGFAQVAKDRLAHFDALKNLPPLFPAERIAVSRLPESANAPLTVDPAALPKHDEPGTPV